MPFVIVAVAATAAEPPPSVMPTPGDSVLVRLGELEEWLHLGGIASPNTSYLGPGQDLLLATERDTLVLPWTAGPATVLFARQADTLAVTFHFEDRFAEQLRERVALLRQYSRFEAGTESRPPPDFTPGWHAADLDALRPTVPVDSIAGQGDDLDRMRRLRRWLHEHVRHDGSREGPREATVAANLKACLDGDLSMNCGGLATTYVAMCTAAGLTARSIVCHPYDPDDPDCHAVAIVRDRSQARWVYMDPSFDAEWSDEQGRLLDLMTARERLARGKAVIVNADADRNGTPRSAEEHLAYMAKNLFRFQDWLDSRTAVHLTPCGYVEAIGGEFPASGPAGAITVVTHDPDWFWASTGTTASPGR